MFNAHKGTNFSLIITRLYMYIRESIDEESFNYSQ